MCDVLWHVTDDVFPLARCNVSHMCQAWVVKVAPQGEIQIPLEYTVEWPMDKEVDFKESF